MDPFRTGEDDRSLSSGHPTEEVLVRAFSGDHSAFQEVVEQLWRLIFIFVRQRVSDRQRAEDITQDTFLQAWEKRATLREPSRAVSWMLAIAYEIGCLSTSPIPRCTKVVVAARPPFS